MRTDPAAAERARSSDGTSIAFWRSVHGRTLVALHGVTIDHSAWDGVRPAGADRGDRRGTGLAAVANRPAWVQVSYAPSGSRVSPNGLPSESLQIAHRSPGCTTLPPSATTRPSASATSLTAK